MNKYAKHLSCFYFLFHLSARMVGSSAYLVRNRSWWFVGLEMDEWMNVCWCRRRRGKFIILNIFTFLNTKMISEKYRGVERPRDSLWRSGDGEFPHEKERHRKVEKSLSQSGKSQKSTFIFFLVCYLRLGLVMLNLASAAFSSSSRRRRRKVSFRKALSIIQ